MKFAKNSNNLNFVIIGGANGSGKTTLAKEYMLTKDFIFLNSDEIGIEINSTDPASVKLKAGKKFIELLNLYINNNKQILIESTLAGKYLLNYIKYAKDKGYHTSLIYLYIDSANEAMLRGNPELN
ncbi:MAG: zeta toxin family protein [bacterium]